jgi:hypothetical protein
MVGFAVLQDADFRTSDDVVGEMNQPRT